MAKRTQWVQIGEAARRLGISTETLKHYAFRGYISVWRNSYGWRFFSSTELAALSKRMRALRPQKFSLHQGRH